MASNGRLGMRSASPSFLVIGLTLVIVVLFYSYWSVSSRNNMLLRDQSILQDRLRTLSSQKIKVEQKYSSARAQMTDVERAKRKLEEKGASSANEKSRLESQIKQLEGEIRVEKMKLVKAQGEGEKSKSELLKLKSEIEATHKKFKNLNGKAESLIVLHKKLQEQLNNQSNELLKVKNDRAVLQVQLEQARSESNPRNVPSKSRTSHQAIPSGTPKKPLAGEGNLPSKPALEVKLVNKSAAIPNINVGLVERSKPTEKLSFKPAVASAIEKKMPEAPTDQDADEEENKDDKITRSRQNTFERKMKTRFGQLKQQNQN